MSNNAPADQTAWHATSIHDTFDMLDSAEHGLGKDDRRQRQEKYGQNLLEQEEGHSKWDLILKQLSSPLIYILIIAAVVSLLIQHYVDAAVIMGVVAINMVIGLIQEWRAEQALEALNELTQPHAVILVDGEQQEIPAEKVVPGDVLILETGDRVAADARIIEADDLELDESALTGESDPVGKKPDEVSEYVPLAERANMAWMSTAVTAGNGKAIIVATGMKTEMGNIAGDVQETEREQTPLQVRMDHFGKWLGGIAMIISIVLFGLGLLRGKSPTEMLIFSVAVAVSAIPEGLPAAISITLALGVRRMARRSAIVRRLPAVETLGSTNVICSDKTGTITRNEMTATHLWTFDGEYEVDGLGYEPEGDIHPPDSDENLKRQDLPEAVNKLLLAGVQANNSQLQKKDDVWGITGDPTEGAMLTVAAKVGIDQHDLQEKASRLDEIPFSSERKYMAVLAASNNGDANILHVKGAPRRILAACSHAMIDGQRQELTDEQRQQIEEQQSTYSDQAMRVLAGACKELDSESASENEAESGLTFLGLWGLVDPPRDSSKDAIDRAQQAGIRVVMITGDNPETAAAIAREVGIGDTETKVLTGPELDDMSEEELSKRSREISVYARVSPSHKARIKDQLQDHGDVVAVTGDGVNDAPALKGANIGIAMGDSGTEVAKEAADMVLTDDNFATIMKAVEEGRVIFANLRRVIFFLLATSLGEVLTFTASLILGMPLPMTAIMVLWVNLVSDAPADIPLGIEPKNDDVMGDSPRDRDAPIVNTAAIWRLCLLGPITAIGTLTLFHFATQHHSLEYAQTVSFTTLAAFQWFLAMASRSERLSVFQIGLFTNRWLILGIFTAILFQLGVVYLPWGQTLFNTEAIELRDWLFILPVASTIWIADEIRKVFARRASSP